MFPEGQHATFVMDNVNFHHNAKFLEAVQQHGHCVEFLPPYSPWLNIAENIFSKVKPVVTQQELVSQAGLTNVLEDTLATITAEDAQGWIQEATRWLSVAEEGVPLGHDHDASTALRRLRFGS